jgi:hypothetical protein
MIFADLFEKQTYKREIQSKLMNRLILILFTLSFTLIYGQEKKVLKLLGDDFQRIPARTNSPYMEPSEVCRIVPSTTVLGDTSGIVYQNEYMLFRNYPNPAQSLSDAALSCVKSTYVSNAEYLEFQNWVRDSIAREYIYDGVESDADAVKLINVSKSEMKSFKFNLDDRTENRSIYNLNWKTKFSYTDPQFLPFLYFLYLSPNERFCKRKDIDERHLRYIYIQSVQKSKGELKKFHSNIPVILFQDFWAAQSASINDEYSVLGQVYDQLLPDQPAVGLTGIQANAFCYWKELQLQQELNKKHLPYLVQVTLPLVSELTVKTPGNLSIPTKDYTSNWKITVKNYQIFMRAVRDSFITEVLYAELPDSKEATKLIQSKPLYFDEGCLKFVKFNSDKRASNREVFALTENGSILKKHKEEIKKIEVRNSDQLDIYKYYRMDIKSKAIVGKLENRERYNLDGLNFEFLHTSEKDSVTKEPIGMDLNLDYVNMLSQGSGVRGHEKYRRFIVPELVQLTPGIPIENQKSEDFIQGISYEQALAYYHWKYPISKVKESNDWQRYVYPNKEQFEQIQKGVQIIVPQHELNYPTPVFRYVITFTAVEN